MVRAFRPLPSSWTTLIEMRLRPRRPHACHDDVSEFNINNLMSDSEPIRASARNRAAEVTRGVLIRCPRFPLRSLILGKGRDSASLDKQGRL